MEQGMEQGMEQAKKQLVRLKSLIEALQSLDPTSVQLLRIIRSEDKTYYFARRIGIKPSEALKKFVQSVSAKYGNVIKEAELIDDYRGDFVKGCIYRLSADDPLIDEAFRELERETADPKTEGEVLKGDWNALLIRGNIEIEGKTKQVDLFSLKNPVTVLKNKFELFDRDQFKELESPVLTLNKSLDAVIADGTFYMLTMQAENLFDMERSYNIRRGDTVKVIKDLKILSDDSAFEEVSKKGQNPRRFASFNQKRLEALKDDADREKYMGQFNIDMEDGRIRTDDPRNCERLIKFLCDKAMLDPVDEKPREVAAAKEWT